MWFKIGKTLGDTLLVASILPEIGGTANPFLPSGSEGKWISIINKNEIESESTPTNFILKTGDILNHTRAVLKNASSILERPEVEGKVVKRYHFVPSKEEEVPDNALESFKNNMVATVSNGYSNLIRELRSLLTPDGTVKPEYTKTMVDSDNREIRDTGKVGNAIKVIICHMKWLKSKMESLVNKIHIEPGSYTHLVEFVRCITPSGSIFGEAISRTKLPLSSFHVISATENNIKAIKIPYYIILSGARNNYSDLLSGDYRLMVLKRLQEIQTIESDFKDPIPTEEQCLEPPAPPQAVGAIAAAASAAPVAPALESDSDEDADGAASRAAGAPAPAARVGPDKKRNVSEAPTPAPTGEEASSESDEEAKLAVKKQKGGEAGIYRIPWEHPAMAELLPKQEANIEIQP